MQEKDEWYFLVCPLCQGHLEKHSSSEFICNSHGSFPILSDIPSFILSPCHEFEKHWKEYKSSRIPSKKIEGAQNFLYPLLKNVLDNEKKILCLDAGCGDGVHNEVLTTQTSLIDLVNLDISFNALLSSKRRTMKKRKFIHGDLSELPIADNTFDCVFSFGVLAYTNNPFQAFQELCRVTAHEGLIGIWVAPKHKGFLGLMFSLIRTLSKWGGSFIQKVIANLLVPFLWLLPIASRVNLSNASWEECKEVILVNIAPSSLYFPDITEIEKWFDTCEIQIIKDSNTYLFGTVWGKKH